MVSSLEIRRSLFIAVLMLGATLAGSASAANKVLFDAAHAQMAGNADWVLDEDTCGSPARFPTPAQSGITSSTPETYWSGAFSSFGVALVKAGYQLETLPPTGRISYGDGTNAQDLSSYDVFIIPEPNVRFTTAEKDAIIAFVQNGGGLFMISDHDNSDRNNDGWDSPEIFNDLMASTSWGLHFQSTGEANNWFSDHPDSKYTADTTSPIVYTGPFGACSAGKGLGLYGATSITLNPTANPNAKGHIWMSAGTADTNTQVTFATTTFGAGRIAAIGDSSPSEDATNNCGHTTYEAWNLTTFDNAIIHLNAVAWLAGAGTPDTTPPTAPTNLTASAGSSSINLSWTASTDNVGVTGYNMYRSPDNVTFGYLGGGSTPGYTDSGLSSGVTYYYRVTATDAAGNESAASNTASATTTVASLTVTAPNGGESWAGGSVHDVTWSSSNVANVKLEYSLDNGGTWASIASSVAASAGTYAWTVPNSGSTTARVRASDAQYGTPLDTSDGVFTITSSNPGQVIINEILANEPGSNTAGEFVELLNVGGAAVDISNWTISDKSAVRHRFAAGTILAAGKAIVVFGGASAIPAGLTNAVAASTGSLNLGNGGDSVVVKSSTGATINSYTYPSSLSGTDGVSMNRNPDTSATGSFVLHTSLSALSSSAGKRVDGTAF